MNAQITRIELFMNTKCQSNKYSAGDWRIRRVQLCKIAPLHGYIRKHGGVKILLVTLGRFFFFYSSIFCFSISQLSSTWRMWDLRQCWGSGTSCHLLPTPPLNLFPKHQALGRARGAKGLGYPALVLNMVSHPGACCTLNHLKLCKVHPSFILNIYDVKTSKGQSWFPWVRSAATMWRSRQLCLG